MKTIHKQVKYKDFEVDEKMLPIIKQLNENGIETLYSCQGGENDRPYVLIKASDKADKFLKEVVKLDDSLSCHFSITHYPSNLEAKIECRCGEYRYYITCLNVELMQYVFNMAIGILNKKEDNKND